MSHDETYEFEHVRKIRETDAAILFDIDGQECWIPRSQIIDIHEFPGIPVYCNVEIPAWFYEQIF